MRFKNIPRSDWCLAVVLIAIAVGCRFFIEIPNFKPVAAMALMGGFLFRYRLMAVGVVIGAMLLSDFQIGFYSLAVMIAVYGSLAFAVLLGSLIQTRWGTESGGWMMAGRMGAASVLMSTVFFLLTNAAVWWTGNGYTPDWVGLIECYIAGVPFYRWTLAGDLVFTSISVGCLTLAQMGARELACQGATASE